MAKSGNRLPVGPARVRLIASGVLVLASLLLTLVFSRLGGALFPAYRAFSKALIAAQAAIASVLPFALWDMVVLGLAVFALAKLVFRLVRRKPLLPWVSSVCLVVSAVGALFICGWALNHYAPPLSVSLGLEVGEYTTQELASATRTYLVQAADLAPRVPRDKNDALERQDFYELAQLAGMSYEQLDSGYEVFRGGSTAPVKALLLAGEPLLYSGHTGIFFSPTGEACVPINCSDADRPFIMCHEAAHRLGIASEQEANFSAYLACASSDDVRFSYSGALNAFGYCLGALASCDSEAAQQLVSEVAAVSSDAEKGVRLVLADRAAAVGWYAKYDGPLEDVGTAVNDGYLKSFGQQDGVRSYGLVVDYLIAWTKADEGAFSELAIPRDAAE